MYEINQDNLGFVWYAARDGTAAALIWMDMRMPVMDGREATHRIRSRQAQEAGGKEVVIVALTASALEEERAEPLAGGCNDLIRKPSQEQEIFAMLHRHLEIEFVCAEEPESAEDHGELTAEHLQALPEEWRDALQDAAKETNPGAANAVIQHIREQDGPLADALAELVRTYRFDTWQALFEGAKS